MRGAAFQFSASDRIEELFGGPDAWGGEFHQLAPGPLRFHAKSLSLPSLRVSFHGARPPLFASEVVRTPGIVLNALIGGLGPVRYRGLEIPVGSCAILRGGNLLDSVWPVEARVLEIEITPPLLEQLGFAMPPHSVLSVEPTALEALVAVCQDIVFPTDPAVGGSVDPEHARDRVLAAIETLMEPWIRDGLREPIDATTETRAYSLAMEAVRIMQIWEGSLRVADLADHLDVSERSVHSAFQRSFGVSPVRFHHIVQMHRVRATLLDSAGERGVVLAAGARVGLTDPSVLSKRYRRCFGESPRATLRWTKAGTRR